MAVLHNNAPLQLKYLHLISSHFRNFRQRGVNIYNFSCHLCGDSETRKHRARAYVMENDKGGFYFYCHKCNRSMSLPYLIRLTDPVLYQEYLKELLTSQDIHYGAPKSSEKPKEKVFNPKATSQGLIKISKLAALHPAREYIRSRMIPTRQDYRIFYTDKFKSYVEGISPGSLKDMEHDEPRIVLPLIQDRKLIGLQGRSLKKNTLVRYITIMFDEKVPRLFGLDVVDTDAPIPVVEGPIDSLFIENCLATAGGQIETEIAKSFLPKDKIVVIYDNEPRSKFTVKKMLNAIDHGFKICIWPSNIVDKDINDMIKRMVGESRHEEVINQKCLQLRNTIMSNTYQGMMAKIKLAEWRKC